MPVWASVRPGWGSHLCLFVVSKSPLSSMHAAFNPTLTPIPICCCTQGANAANVPKPTGSGVFISSLPAMEVYVLSYGGWSNPTTEREKATELIKTLEAAKEPFSNQYWFTAGYDSPYQLANRHNEVWVPKTAAAGSTAAEAGAASKKAEAGR